MVQWLRICLLDAGGVGLIPGQGTKIPHASQGSNKKKTPAHEAYFPKSYGFKINLVYPTVNTTLPIYSSRVSWHFSPLALFENQLVKFYRIWLKLHWIQSPIGDKLIPFFDTETSCHEFGIHLNLFRPWCWKRLRAGEGNDRGWDGWMASLTRYLESEQTAGDSEGQGSHVYCSPWGCKESDTT